MRSCGRDHKQRVQEVQISYGKAGFANARSVMLYQLNPGGPRDESNVSSLSQLRVAITKEGTMGMCGRPTSLSPLDSCIIRVATIDSQHSDYTKGIHRLDGTMLTALSGCEANMLTRSLDPTSGEYRVDKAPTLQV